MIKLTFISISILVISYILIAPRLTIRKQNKIIDGKTEEIYKINITNYELNRTVDVKTFEQNLTKMRPKHKERKYEKLDLSNGNHTTTI